MDTNTQARLPSAGHMLDNGAIPLTWWTVAPNFGDLLSPYLVSRLAGRPVKRVDLKPGRGRRFEWLAFRKPQASCLAIGSIISRANSRSIVWGSGAFGTEKKRDLNRDARYLAVRGPLTRNMLRMQGIECPAVYGDPALLLPRVFNPEVSKRHKVGLVLRWSETEWNSRPVDEGILRIHLGSVDVERTIRDMLSCEMIVSSSLHGLVIADAYGIPSAWLASDTPKGLEFKFYDYFLGVGKLRPPQQVDLTAESPVGLDTLRQELKFTDGRIDFDETPLLDACPFLETGRMAEAAGHLRMTA